MRYCPHDIRSESGSSDMLVERIAAEIGEETLFPIF